MRLDLALFSLALIGALHVGSPASAETPSYDAYPTDCTTPGWLLDDRAPALVDGLLGDQTIILPVVATLGAPRPVPPLEGQLLSVVVTDAAGAVVDGALDALKPMSFQGAFRVLSLGALPFLSWRPAATLTPGVYSAKVVVHRPLVAFDQRVCNFQDFERVVTFTVIAEPTPMPAPQLALEFLRDTYQPESWAAECPEGHTRVFCEDEVTSCCISHPIAAGFTFRTTASVTGLTPAQVLSHVLVLEVDTGSFSGDTQLLIYRDFGAGDPYVATYQLQGLSSVVPGFGQQRYCTRASLVDLTTGAVSASASGCVYTQEVTEREAPPVRECDPRACLERADASQLAEPSPEPAPDAQWSEVSGAVDVSSAAAAEPQGDRDEGGCATGGPLDLSALALLAVFVGWRRRTRGVFAPAILGLLLVGVPHSRAETTAPDTSAADCTTPGWLVDDRVPVTLVNLPQTPLVILPVVWVPGAPTPTPPLMGPLLSVVVSDAAGAPVLGLLRVHSTVDYVGEGRTETFGDRRFLAWATETELAVGSYSAVVTLTKPAPPWNSTACDFQDFEATVTFNVVADPYPIPTPEITLSFTRHDAYDLLYDDACDGAEYRLYCNDRVHFCCTGTQTLLYFELHTRVKVRDLYGNQNFYQVLAIETDNPQGFSRSSIVFEHPLRVGMAVEDTVRFYRRNDDFPDFRVPELCVRATLIDFATNQVATSATECITTTQPEVGEMARLSSCSALECDHLAENKPVADPAPSAGPDPADQAGDGCKAGGDGHLPAVGLTCLLTIAGLRRWRARHA